MNIFSSLFNRFWSAFNRGPNEEVNLIEPTPLKRRKNENIFEDMPIKKRKPNVTAPEKDGNNSVSPYLLRRPFGVGSKENSRFNLRTLRIFDAAMKKNNTTRDNHQIYCLDSDNEESSDSQKNASPRNEGRKQLKEVNRNPQSITMDLCNDDISSGSRLDTSAPVQRRKAGPTFPELCLNKVNRNPQSITIDLCNDDISSGSILSTSTPVQRRNTGPTFPELCLNKIQKQKDEAVFFEMVLRSSPCRKSIPLTNSAIHNTKQNKQIANDTSSNRRYSLRQQQLPVIRQKVSSPKLNVTVPERNAALKAFIDLTGDDDDDAQRQEIQSSVASSSNIRNLKSDFVAEDSFMLDPDLSTSISKKYNSTIRDIEKRASALQKELHRHREDFQQTISDIFEKRLTLKEVTRSDKEFVDERPSIEIAPLTKEMIIEINEIMASGKYPLVQIKDTAVKKQDIRTLENRCWLNDEIINAYMNLIKLRAEKNPNRYPKVHCFNTFLYEQLSKKGYNSVRRWTRKIDIFDFEIIIVPIHLGNHWCLIQIKFSQKIIKYYDSMGSPNTRCLNTMLQYLVDEYEDKKNGATFEASDWQLINVPINEIPQQENAYDCGVFACTYAEHITRNASFSFDQQQMQYFRLKMMYEILTGELLL